MSLKSVFSKPFTVIQCQSLPPLRDLPTVPAEPLTHTILSLTTDNPRKEALGPEGRSSTAGVGFCAIMSAWKKRSVKTDKIILIVGNKSTEYTKGLSALYSNGRKKVHRVYHI
jgi:hypothetical protein